MPHIRNIALMAHVDAGKTTLTERLLYEAGAVRVLGSVDAGTARTDDLAVERARGISVRAAFTSFTTGDLTINLIDTPGHADFYSQVERTFWAVDAVVLLMSAVDGIQSGTEAIASEAVASGIPVLFFINKCDRETADPAAVTAQIKALRDSAYDYETERYEAAALRDDALMQAFVDGEPEDTAAVLDVLRAHIREAAPILCGSAHTGEGVAQLVEAVGALVPHTAGEGPPAGVVFSAAHDKTFGRGAYIRLYAGNLRVRDSLTVNGIAYKITIIRRQENGRWKDAGEFHAGDIALVYGLADCKTGDCFGEGLPPHIDRGRRKALLTAQIAPDTPADGTALRAALEIMTAEDPSLELEWEPTAGKLHINVMGVVQMETLPALIEERFGIKTAVGEPEIIYKETLAHSAVGFDAYTMPKPCWAVLKFQLTPAPRGSGITYTCTAAPNRLSYRYREQVAQSIAPSLKQGPYGWEVTDMDIELVDGEDHHIHTHPLDFTIATPLALADGLRNGGTVLLEPILEAKFTFDQKHLGRILSDVIRMRGQTQSQAYHGDNITLTALLPLASSLEYPIAFASITSGLGIMTQRLHGYRECPLELGRTRPRRGVDPLDRSKYILAARNALTGTVFGD